ncbi:hypothetical protein A3F37_01190 [Candidatus Saccharibacteria bacterium RIFCSPHIGHO2_12_FULL_41_12]|nr:MAG: hypothetical protein A3F37_01190 [Candidatus Saccharibacteria bacterium RIFCSPHIGHO2_12_FULL_41_12]
MAKIAIVDENDNVIGSEEWDVVRAKGLRHRIVRIFVINSDGKILLHKRNESLKDNPGKWDQSAGGHVDEGEDYVTAAKRETHEELGIEIDKFTKIGKFYIEREAPGGIARRFHTVFTCKWDGDINFAKSEIAEIGWFSVDEIDLWFKKSPDRFTINFAKAFALLKQSLSSEADYRQ